MKREWFIISILTLVIVATSLHETWLFARKTPQGTVYPLVHGYIPDYYYYLSLIEQGKEGRLLLTTRYTSELFQPLPVQTFYAVVGVIAGIFHIWTPTIYLILRILFGVGLLLSGYYLITKLFKDFNARLPGFLLMLFGVPLWFILDGNIWTVGNFWRGIDPLNRVTFIPHHLAANVFLIFALLSVARGVGLKGYTHIIGAAILGFLTGWINPASVLALLFSIATLGLFRIRGARTYWPKLFFIGVISSLPLFIFSYYQETVFPWTEYKRIETFWRYPLDLIVYLKIMSVGGFFALVAIPEVLKKKQILWDLIVGWFFWPVIGLGILQYITPMSNARFIQAAYYIPTGILGAYGIMLSITFLKKRGISQKVTAICIAALFLMASLPSFYANIIMNQLNVGVDSKKLSMYPFRTLLSSIDWLNTYGESDDLVVAPAWISTIIPALSDKRVLLGHPTLTYQSDGKQKDMDTLYAFKDESEVALVIQKHRVSLVWADETLKVPETFAGYEFSPVFKNSLVTYYRVALMK